jgi:integrase
MGDELPTGIRRTPKGFQSYVWRHDPTRPKGGYQTSKRWPPSTSIAVMKQWRVEQEMRGKHPHLFVAPDPAQTLFADDARTDYLTREKVTSMPTLEQRTQHINEWIKLFGHRERKTITDRDIQKALDDMRKRMSAGSVNKRRTALMDLWTVLDGRHQANPVKATTVYEEPAPLPRAPELAAVLKLLKGLPARTDYGKKCRARLKVIAWTGWPHAIVKQLEPADLPHWKQGRAFVQRRKKGKGARARWLPLLPEAVKALREFHAVDAYGDFSNSSLHKRVTAFCRTQKVAHIRPYDLRHFFGTLIATLTQDERVIMELMLVSTPAIIRRYTEAATNPRVQAAVKGIVGQLPALLKAAEKRVKTEPDSASVLPRTATRVKS